MAHIFRETNLTIMYSEAAGIEMVWAQYTVDAWLPFVWSGPYLPISQISQKSTHYFSSHSVKRDVNKWWWK